jgi:hypothetical protein
MTKQGGPLAAEIVAIRNYTNAHPHLGGCHHFSFDFRLGKSERAGFIVMGMNPGETQDDRDFAPAPCEESSLVDYRQGIDSRARARWFSTCRMMLGTDEIALTEVCFWSSPTFTEFVTRAGPEHLAAHLAFCRAQNERLIAYHQPRAVALPGLSLIQTVASLYGLTHVETIRFGPQGPRLVEAYVRDGTPWVFTKHWSGARGFSTGQKRIVRDYLRTVGDPRENDLATNKVVAVKSFAMPETTRRLKFSVAGEPMDGPQAHPKYQAASQLVKTSVREICAALEEAGLQFQSSVRRDGFSYSSAAGFQIKIDPKVENIRINVGRQPFPPVPRELVHPGRQDDWIVVTPQHTQLTLIYLQALVRGK